MTLELKEKNDELVKLLPLLNKNPDDLSDEELSRLIAAKKIIFNFINHASRTFPKNFESTWHYRQQKNRLSRLTQEELKKIEREKIEELNSELEPVERQTFFESWLRHLPRSATMRIVRELLSEQGTPLTIKFA